MKKDRITKHFEGRVTNALRKLHTHVIKIMNLRMPVRSRALKVFSYLRVEVLVIYT